MKVITLERIIESYISNIYYYQGGSIIHFLHTCAVNIVRPQQLIFEGLRLMLQVERLAQAFQNTESSTISHLQAVFREEQIVCLHDKRILPSNEHKSLPLLIRIISSIQVEILFAEVLVGSIGFWGTQHLHEC